MAKPSVTNGYGDSPPAAQLANPTVQGVEPAPLAAKRRKRSRATSAKPLTVSLVIPVKNEARNIAWVLEQVADEVNEVILVDGNSTDAIRALVLAVCPPSACVITISPLYTPVLPHVVTDNLGRF